jgi:hypothetical protein
MSRTGYRVGLAGLVVAAGAGLAVLVGGSWRTVLIVVLSVVITAAGLLLFASLHPVRALARDLHDVLRWCWSWVRRPPHRRWSKPRDWASRHALLVEGEESRQRLFLELFWPVSERHSDAYGNHKHYGKMKATCEVRHRGASWSADTDRTDTFAIRVRFPEDFPTADDWPPEPGRYTVRWLAPEIERVPYGQFWVGRDGQLAPSRTKRAYQRLRIPVANVFRHLTGKPKLLRSRGGWGLPVNPDWKPKRRLSRPSWGR